MDVEDSRQAGAFEITQRDIDRGMDLFAKFFPDEFDFNTAEALTLFTECMFDVVVHAKGAERRAGLIPGLHRSSS